MAADVVELILGLWEQKVATAPGPVVMAKQTVALSFVVN